MLRGARSVVSLASTAGLRAARVAPRTSLSASRVLCAPRAAALPAAVAPARLRFYSSTQSARLLDTPARIVNYDEVKEIVSKNDAGTIIVDTREPDEYAAGHLPHAVNIPFKSMPGALGLDAADFESALGFAKPDPSKTLVFYCLGGVRSSGSEQLASTYGYNHRLNYKGSYQDWVEHEGSTSGAAQQ